MEAWTFSSSATILPGSLRGSTCTPLCRFPRIARSSSLVAVISSSSAVIIDCLRSSTKECADSMFLEYIVTASCRSSITTESLVGTLTSYVLRSSYISSTSVAASTCAPWFAAAAARALSKSTNSSSSSGRRLSFPLRSAYDASTLAASSCALSSSSPFTSSMVRCVMGSSELRRGRESTLSTPTTFPILSRSMTCRQSRCWFMSVRYERRSRGLAR
mmetsp:Transcript_14306/g.34740  ORF Transcript_14306/g.34740 Transcript_14306/m.34740 type:complete len:217 (-) Transcript_14306:2033-2683(-)